RSLSRHPLFQVNLVLQNNAEAAAGLGGLDAVPEPVGVGIAKFDLSLAFGETRDADDAPAGVEGTLEYACDLFDRATARLLAERLGRLFEAVAADPDVPIG